MDKAALRADLKQRVAGIRKALRAQQEDLVNAAIISDEDWRHADTVLVYRAIGDELSVVSAANDAMRAGKRVCFPKVRPGNALSLHHVTDWAQLEPGAYGIPEPVAGCPLVTPMDVDIAVVPGVGFTRAGQRLGQGGGFYDRLLPALGGISWGVCYDEQVLDALPIEPHDRPVDRVIWPGSLQ